MNAKAHEVIPAEAAPVAAVNSASLLQVIERAARDSSVDIDKMERLMAMHERMVARDAETAFNEAMTACQADVRQIAADAENPQTRSRYATYAQLDRYLRPIYTTHGFALSFDEGESTKPEHVRVVCYVSHVRGFTRTYHRDMPADGKGAKGGDVMTKTHAAGAAGSYGARYLLKGIFNVAIGEYDVDGNDPRESKGMPEDELQAWVKKIEAATTKDKAKDVCTEGIKEANKYNDLSAYNALKGAHKAQCDFIDTAK